MRGRRGLRATAGGGKETKTAAGEGYGKEITFATQPSEKMSWREEMVRHKGRHGTEFVLEERKEGEWKERLLLHTFLAGVSSLKDVNKRGRLLAEKLHSQLVYLFHLPAFPPISKPVLESSPPIPPLPHSRLSARASSKTVGTHRVLCHSHAAPSGAMPLFNRQNCGRFDDGVDVAKGSGVKVAVNMGADARFLADLCEKCAEGVAIGLGIAQEKAATDGCAGGWRART